MAAFALLVLGGVLLQGTRSAAEEEAKCTIRRADYNDIVVVPESYDVAIRTEFRSRGILSRLVGRKADQKFKGNVTMRFNALMATPELTLHALNITLSDAEYRQLPAGQWKPLSIVMNAQKEHAVFTANGGIASGPGEFRCRFKGKMQPSTGSVPGQGLLIFNHTGPDGADSFGVVSNLAPEGARRVFPCVDFPKYKAKFTLSLVIPNSLDAFSNTERVKEVKLGDDYKLVTFAETPAMSSFSLALVIGAFHAEEQTPTGGPKLRLLVSHARTAHFKSMKRALDAVQTLLPAIQDYTGSPLPGVNKIDIIGAVHEVPMVQSYGLIIVPDYVLLSTNRNYQPVEQSAADIALKSQLGYAISKIWFQADITPEYWDNIWLSEGMSTFLSSLVNAKLQPPREQWVDFDRSPSRRLNVLDAANDSPAEFSFGEPYLVVHSSVVRLATQDKASIYLWMLYRFVNDDDKFKKGLRLYSSRHRGGLVKTANFTNSFEEATGVDTEWLQRIVKLRGSITLHVDCEQRSNNRVLTLRQIHLRRQGLPCPRRDLTWTFPIVVDTEDGKSHQYLIGEPLTTITVPGVAWKTKWVKLNQLSSYYRVLYSENCLANFGLYKGLGAIGHDHNLRGAAIPPLEKQMILDDIIYLDGIYTRHGVRPDDSEAAQVTDVYEFAKIRQGITQAVTAGAGNSTATAATGRRR